MDITDDLILSGDVVTTVINGGNLYRVFHIIGSAAVTMTDLTIQGGRAADGAGIFVDGGDLTVISSTIQLNAADNHGGGIHNLAGSVTLLNSTVNGNTAVTSGAAIFSQGGTANITNSTVNGNTAPDGSAIYSDNSDVQILNSTIHQNSAATGAGIAHISGSLVLKNTIVSGSSPGTNCSGAVVSNGHNLADDTSCNLTEPSDFPDVNPLLGLLADNGGPTWTHALLFGSPAIEGGDDAQCPPTDQRGSPRFGVCDIGAYEVEIYFLYLPLIVKPSDTPPVEPGDCDRQVPVFTTDTAPADGTLEFHVLFGEFARIEGITLRVWDVSAGQQINNELVDVHAPKWVRVWWLPDGDTEWYLLPSQYWVGDGTVASEYGVSCGNDPVPSYHTSFADAIPESELPIFTLPDGADWVAIINALTAQRTDSKRP